MKTILFLSCISVVALASDGMLMLSVKGKEMRIALPFQEDVFYYNCALDQSFVEQVQGKLHYKLAVGDVRLEDVMHSGLSLKAFFESIKGLNLAGKRSITIVGTLIKQAGYYTLMLVQHNNGKIVSKITKSCELGSIYIHKITNGISLNFLLPSQSNAEKKHEAYKEECVKEKHLSFAIDRSAANDSNNDDNTTKGVTNLSIEQQVDTTSANCSCSRKLQYHHGVLDFINIHYN